MGSCDRKAVIDEAKCGDIGGSAGMTYFKLATANWLTLIYLIMLAVTVVAVAVNILREEKLSAQIVGGMVLIPLMLRLLLVK